MTDLRAWCDEAWTFLRGHWPEIAGTLSAAWQAHRERRNVVACLIGPYDSGKSTPLKRLLLDHDLPIPEWLTISGRRETFEVQEASVAGLVFRDTPGLRSNKAEHDERALAAILFCDVPLIVLPPQLVTGDRDVIVGLANGSRFACPPNVAYAPNSLILVLSRMDEAGPSPQDDPEEYQELLTRKISELRRLMQANGVPDGIWTVFAVAADPFAQVGNRANATRTDFDAYRGWDGVASLTAALNTLGSRRDPLRLHAELRLLAFQLRLLAEACEREAAERRQSAETAANEARVYEAARRRLQAVLDAARADLDRRVEEVIAFAKRRLEVREQTDLSDFLRRELEKEAVRWSRRFDDEVANFLQEIEAEQEKRRERPAWRLLIEGVKRPDCERQPLETEPEPAEPVLGSWVILEKALRSLHEAFRKGQAIVTGMDMDTLRAQLQKLDEAGSFRKYLKTFQGNGPPLRTKDSAEWARLMVRIDQGVAIVIPLVPELAELWQDQREAERRAAHRAELGRRIEQEAKDLAQWVWKEWRKETAVAEVESTMQERAEAARAAGRAFQAESERLFALAREARARLAALSMAPASEE